MKQHESPRKGIGNGLAIIRRKRRSVKQARTCGRSWNSHLLIQYRKATRSSGYERPRTVDQAKSQIIEITTVAWTSIIGSRLAAPTDGEDDLAEWSTTNFQSSRSSRNTGCDGSRLPSMTETTRPSYALVASDSMV